MMGVGDGIRRTPVLVNLKHFISPMAVEKSLVVKKDCPSFDLRCRVHKGLNLQYGTKSILHTVWDNVLGRKYYVHTDGGIVQYDRYGTVCRLPLKRSNGLGDF